MTLITRATKSMIAQEDFPSDKEGCELRRLFLPLTNDDVLSPSQHSSFHWLKGESESSCCKRDSDDSRGRIRFSRFSCQNSCNKRNKIPSFFIPNRSHSMLMSFSYRCTFLHFQPSLTNKALFLTSFLCCPCLTPQKDIQLQLLKLIQPTIAVRFETYVKTSESKIKNNHGKSKSDHPTIVFNNVYNNNNNHYYNFFSSHNTSFICCFWKSSCEYVTTDPSSCCCTIQQSIIIIIIIVSVRIVIYI